MSLQNQRPGSPLRGESILPETIVFRLDDENNRLLCQRAATLKMSPGELARVYLVEALHQSVSRDDWCGTISQLQKRMDQLAAGHALAVEALLASAGRVDREFAHQWVNLNLRGSLAANPKT